jgi:hypothetical protein
MQYGYDKLTTDVAGSLEGAGVFHLTLASSKEGDHPGGHEGKR